MAKLIYKLQIVTALELQQGTNNFSTPTYNTTDVFAQHIFSGKP